MKKQTLKLLTILVVGVHLTATSRALANSPTLACTNEDAKDFRVKYLQKPSIIVDKATGKEFAGFTQEQAGDLLQLDCSLQKTEKAYSLRGDLVQQLDELNANYAKQITIFEQKHLADNEEIKSLIIENGKLQTELDNIKVVDQPDPWYLKVLYIGSSFVAGGLVGIIIGVTAIR